MDIVEAIKNRKSIRGFKPDPVPKEILGKILEIATQAPSGVNRQSWEFTVIAGEVLDKIRQANVDEMLKPRTRPRADTQPRPSPTIYRQRQVELAVQLFQLMGIGREDKDKRAEWTKRGFRYFDAPAAIIISVDDSLDAASTNIDVGTITQTIALTALDYGLGTCIASQGVMYPQVLRQFAGIPESKRPAISISIGYPDWEFPANNIQSKREPVENITTWCGI